MKKYICTTNDTGKKVIRVIQENINEFSFAQIKKAFRKKDIKINGKWTKEDSVISDGDTIEIYISEEETKKWYSVVYEDDNLMIINKASGISCHDDKDNSSTNLLNLLNKDFKEEIYLCHRLDRNTEGLMIVAKGRENSDCLRAAIKEGATNKFYKCIVEGIPDIKEDTLYAYLQKDAKNNLVTVTDYDKQGAVPIKTGYTVLKEYEDKSLLEITLYTGRTHQIRAHMAHIGYPVIGDGKYGTNITNKKHKEKRQLLCAYKISFNEVKYEHLAYLSGKEFQIEPTFLKD